MKTGGAKNCLKRGEAFRLGTWVQSKKDQFERERKTATEIAAEAGKELKLTLTATNVRSIYKMLGYTSPHGGNWGGKRPGGYATGAKVAVLARYVHNICLQLGLPVGEDLNKLVKCDPEPEK